MRLRRALRRGGGRWQYPVVVFAAATVVVFVVGQLSVHLLPVEAQSHRWPYHRWLDTFARWDTGWYWHIATDGYFYDGPGRQSAVAFFPAFPFAMRLASRVLPGDVIVAGVIVSLVSGVAVAVLFFEWCRAAFGDAVARLATLLLFLYPFAFYLFGAVYSEALFVAAALAAFLLLEDDHPVLAGLAGALATAARPIGLAVVAGLVLRQLELRGVLGTTRPRLSRLVAGSGAQRRNPIVPRRLDLRRLQRIDASVLLSLLGVLAYCAFLWWRFGEPLAFIKVETAEGWNRKLDLRSLTMLDYFRLMRDYGLNIITFALTIQGVASLITVGLIPTIIRRLGWGYGGYTVVAVMTPLLSSSNFFAMGRYVLVAFPAFAVAAALLAERSLRLRLGVLTVNGGLMLFFASLFARWYLLS